MEDNDIIDLYWCRSESAIIETASKYSRYCYSIAFHILHNNADAEECVNDTFFRAWNAMPPNRPNNLTVFLGKITRNLALDKHKKAMTHKRGLGQTALALTELEECIPSPSTVEQEVDEKELAALLDQFLKNLLREKRIMFVQRYWYFLSIKEIAIRMGVRESQVKSTLFSLRKKLKNLLEKEGIVL